MYKSETLNILRFDSVAELSSYMTDSRMASSYGDANQSWAGGISQKTARLLAIDGDVSQVAAAERLMSKFENEFETTMRMDMPSVAGCYPCVPEAISGEPECMREPMEASTDAAPLTILVDVSSSASVNSQKMRERGIAILALVMMLSASRPVTLELVCIQEGPRRPDANNDGFSIISARVNTAPLDLATAAFAITHVGFARHLMYDLSDSIGGMKDGGRFGYFVGLKTGPSYVDGFNENTTAYRERICGYLGIEGEALIVPPAIQFDAPILNNPEAWVRAQIARFGRRDD